MIVAIIEAEEGQVGVVINELLQLFFRAIGKKEVRQALLHNQSTLAFNYLCYSVHRTESLHAHRH